MPQKTITLQPQAWAVRDDPGGTLAWTPTIGSANMLAAVDGDKANCVNATTLSADSDPLDAKTFWNIATGALPVFEGDARNPQLTIRCQFGANDGLNAGPFVYAADSAAMGSADEMGPFATVNAVGLYSRISALPNKVNIFNALSSGRFFVSTIFPSRPLDAGMGSKSLMWDMVSAELAYTYGPNTTPNPFDFLNAYGVGGTNVLSAALQITGIDTPQLVSIAGDASAVFSVNGDAFSAVARNISAGQTLQLRMTAPATVGTFVDCVVTVETRTDAWRVTSGSDVPTALNPPADLVNVVPGYVLPDSIAFPGLSLMYQPRGNTVPMSFYLSWDDLSKVQYSIVSASGPWVDGAVESTLPLNGNIWLRVKTPTGPARVGTLVLNYASGQAAVHRITTVGPSGNSFAYHILNNAPARVVQAGDYLEWEVFVDPESTTIAGVPPFGVGGFDLGFTDATAMRSLASICVDGLACHFPNWTAGYNPRGQWLRRRLSLAIAVGKTILNPYCCNESDSAGNFVSRYRNVRIVDSLGTVRQSLWTSGDAVLGTVLGTSQASGSLAAEVDASAKRQDITLISTGAVGFVYSLDLSAVDTFYVAAGTKPWVPTVSGAARHSSIGSPTSDATFTAFSSVNTDVEVGRWWRKADGGLMAWPVGTKLKGIGYGMGRDLNYGSGASGITTMKYYLRNIAASGYDLLPGVDDVNSQNAVVYVNGVSPGIVPAGWTTDQLLAAINADTLAIGHAAFFTESAGFAGSARAVTTRLRVFFEVARPPEGNVWEF